MTIDSAEEREELKQALELYQEQWLADLPDEKELEQITFSPSFEKRMKKMMFRQKHKFFTRINTSRKRVACLLTAAFVALVVTSFSAKVAANPVIDFFVDVYEKFSTIIFPQTSSVSSVIFEAAAPAVLPDGFHVESERLLDNLYHCKYINGKGDVILYDQALYQNAQTNLDTENTVTHNIPLNGTTAVCVEKNGSFLLVWNDGIYSYTISGAQNRDDLIQMAESLQPAETE